MEEDFPYSYLLNAKTFPSNPSYVLSLTKYSIPLGDVVKVYEVDSEPKDVNIDDFFQEEIYQRNKVVFQLIKYEKNQPLQVIDEIPISDRGNNIMYHFSKDGSRFALLIDDKLKIYKVDKPEDLLREMKTGETGPQYIEVVDRQILNTERIYFDINMRFVALYNSTSINILPLYGEVSEQSLIRYDIGSVKRVKFEQIYDL